MSASEPGFRKVVDNAADWLGHFVEESWLFDPQTSAAGAPTSADVQFSLEIGILDLGEFRWTKANGGQNGGQTHS